MTCTDCTIDIMPSKHAQRHDISRFDTIHFVYTYHIAHSISYHIVLYHTISYHIIEGSLEVKLPTIWTDEKQSREEAERRERLEERRVRRKKVQMREKVGKSRNTVFFQ